MITRKAPRCLACFAKPVNSLLSITSSFPRRWASFKRDLPPVDSGPSNPILDQYLRNKPRPTLQRGSLTKDSIFADDDADATSTDPENKKYAMDPSAVAHALDPDPQARRRWERKMVIRSVRKSGRLSKTELLKRTERESTAKSPLFKTSTKKLGALARQLVGKPIDDAILQMRFSKKIAALDVREHLEYAKAQAIAVRGMGLGQVEGTAGEPMDVQLKNGKRHKIADRTGIYVDEAWVGRGTYGSGYDFRARGKVHRLRLPYTTLTVVLREEATRIRQHEERETKRANRKVWMQLPDRPVTTQRQYYSW